MSGSVIVAGARTPMGRLLGSLKGFSAAELGGIAIKGALEKAGVSGDQVEYVIMGHVIQAGAGQITARQAAVAGGIPLDVPALTINKVCLSGIDAIALADQLIRAGEFDIVVAGGMESMTNAPHLLRRQPRGREVRRLDDEGLDGPRRAVLRHRPPAMGLSTEQFNSPATTSPARSRTSSRRARTSWRPRRRRTGCSTTRSCRSHRPAAQGRPDRVQRGRGRARRHHRRVAVAAAPGVHQGRHHHRRLGLADLRRRRAVVVMSKAKAEELGLTWLAEIGAHGVVAGPDASLQEQPANAVLKACAKEGIAPADLDLLELNEAFAAVGHRLDQEARRGPGEGQRQRWRDRHGAPGRHVRRPDRAAPGPRAQAARRRRRRRRLCGGGGQGDAPDRPRVPSTTCDRIAEPSRGRSARSGLGRERASVDVDQLVERALAGDPRSVGRLITLVEDGARRSCVR